MAQIFVSTVYRVNASDLVTPELQGFNPTNVKFRPVIGIVTAGPNSQRVYGIIQEKQTGLVVDQTQFYVIETVQQLQTLANA